MWYIFGGKGWIGQQFIKILEKEEIRYQIPSFRLDDTKTFQQFIKDKVWTENDRIICFIGRTHGEGCTTIDYLEKGRPQLIENVRDNLYGPLSAAILCREYQIHFTYLGTGCIFQYDEDHTLTNEEGFLESDLPNFFDSSYSIVKGFTDRFMNIFEDHVLQARIRMPINEDMESSRNFLKKITTYDKICSISNSMTVLPDVLPILVDLVRKKKTGTYNLTNPGTISHNEILNMYQTIVDPLFTYQNFSLEEQSKILKAGRSNNLLDTTKLENEYFILPIYQSIQRLLKKIRKQRLLQQEWNPKCILVTGGCGFIGSNFLHFLSETLPHVTLVNIDNLSYCSRYEHIQDIPKLHHYCINLNNTTKITEILENHDVDTIVHFAAQSHVDNSFNNSLCFTEDNVRGTHSLLEATKHYKRIQRFIHISTDEVYGENTTQESFNEQSMPQPTNPYAATKIAAEFLVQSYFHCFELPVVIIRANNVYGPRQYPEKVIPKFILRLLQREKCTIHGNGYTRRNFLFVQDMCHAVYTVLQHGQLHEIYNIGVDGNEHTVLDIARKLVFLLYGPHCDVNQFLQYVGDRFYNDFTYRISAEKLQQLGWKPRTPFSVGLQKTIEYYQTHLHLFMPITTHTHDDEK